MTDNQRSLGRSTTRHALGRTLNADAVVGMQKGSIGLVIDPVRALHLITMVYTLRLSTRAMVVEDQMSKH